MGKRKTQFEKGIDNGYISCTNAVLNYMDSADKQHVQGLAEYLGVTHDEMLLIQDEDELYFEENINKNSSYWSGKSKLTEESK